MALLTDLNNFTSLAHTSWDTSDSLSQLDGTRYSVKAVHHINVTHAMWGVNCTGEYFYIFYTHSLLIMYIALIIQ